MCQVVTVRYSQEAKTNIHRQSIPDCKDKGTKSHFQIQDKTSKTDLSLVLDDDVT